MCAANSVVSGGVSLARQIEAERLRLGWSQALLAGRAGLPLRSYQRFAQTGQVTLARLLTVATALGLTVSLTGGAPGGPVTDPRLNRVRQRGLRQPRTAAGPARPATAGEPTPGPAGTARPRDPAPGTARPAVSAAAIAELRKRLRDAIEGAARAIVANRLDNYSARNVVQATLQARHVDTDGERAAFVAAVEAELGRLTPENCHGIGIDPRQLEAWTPGWKPELGIDRALE